MEYQVELKQIVSFPRCRIYRTFIRSLMEEKSIRLGRCSFFSFYAILCSYANYQTHAVGIDGIKYTCRPGEWACRVSEMAAWFRMKSKRQVLKVLETLRENGFIEFKVLGRGHIIKYKITDWEKSNRIIEDYAPCRKDEGFFFFPIHQAHELVSMAKSSETDILLDLWMHAVYNDPQVSGSHLGPVVYFRNHTGNPLASYSDLARRWGLSKSSVSRILKKLSDLGFLRLLTFPGRHGTVIYPQQYLSTMFGISDVMIDKEELAAVLQIRISVADPSPKSPVAVRVLNDNTCVPFPVLDSLIEKLPNVLYLQGFPCGKCGKASYILSDLSACPGKLLLEVKCPKRLESDFFEVAFAQKSGRKQFHCETPDSTSMKGVF